jgi:hypothetical protein
MMLKAEKHYGKNEITSSNPRKYNYEEPSMKTNITHDPQEPLISVNSPVRTRDYNGKIKTYVRKIGSIKESKELKAHRKRLLEAFTLK